MAKHNYCSTGTVPTETFPEVDDGWPVVAIPAGISDEREQRLTDVTTVSMHNRSCHEQRRRPES